MLDRQINIYSVDTGNFYSNKESYLHWKNHKLRNERKQLINGYNLKRANGRIKNIIGTKEIEKEFEKYNLCKKDIELIQKREYDFSNSKLDEDTINSLVDQYFYLLKLIEIKNKSIKDTKATLLELLANKAEANIQSGGKHHLRELNENQVSNKNIISVFDSSFTRMIGAKQDELCEDFMVVQIYYFDVAKDLIYHGFTYKGEKYIYFTSSAGQIRTKKTVFIKESVWNKYEKTIMCGLTIDDINKKGGNNPNKHLAYMALANSATDVWEEFDIDKTIVINDFETDVFGTYDLVDDKDYSIKRKCVLDNDYVPIPIAHTDGAGMMLPNAFGKIQRNQMIRCPWIKGLLGVFDYVKFIKENDCSSIIKDIYGVEHDVIKEDIQVILTKSQFKLWKYYSSWDEYKEYFKKYGCTANYTNPEEERIKDATINYQMLQSLVDIKDEEILKIASDSIEKLNNITSSVDNMKAIFGVTAYNTNKNSFQKSIELYPNLLNDEYAKSRIKEIKDSMVKNYKAGKLQVRGNYTFILPDLYAACEHWFMGIENPDGLLDDGEVFCSLFKKDEKLDCLRSPHLYMEHAIRRNIACEKYKERQKQLGKWYCTKAIYTSCKDLISKILQFDVDGDKSLVLADKTIISVAERNIKKYNIVPLYYNMRKAEPIHLSNETIYNGLSIAFTGSNIGQYSNSISKIWNNDVFIGNTDEKMSEEEKKALDVIKLLCMENNFKIDYAKTLYMPERPDSIKDLITDFTNINLPHFFVYAKDKEEHQVSLINNSFVNKLNNIIQNPRISYRNLKLDNVDYKLLMNNPDISFNVSFTDNGRIIAENTDPLIVKYCELNKKYGYSINNTTQIDETFSIDILKNSQLRKNIKYKQICEEVKSEFSKFGYTDIEIADILVKFLYYIKKSKHKDILWLCYGEYILENLKKNFKLRTKEIQCVDCGKWFEVNIFDSETCRCKECVLEHKKILKKEQNKRAYEKKKNSVAPL